MKANERAELKSIVRNQFKVLRAEVRQRQAELYAQLAAEIEERCTNERERRGTIEYQVRQAILECNRKINDLLYEGEFQVKGSSERMWIHVPSVFASYNGVNTEESNLKQRASSDIAARVAGALTSIDRQEADLLRDLAVGVIESEDARAFLAKIPSVSELVPTSRLAELEAAWGE